MSEYRKIEIRHWAFLSEAQSAFLIGTFFLVGCSQSENQTHVAAQEDGGQIVQSDTQSNSKATEDKTTRKLSAAPRITMLRAKYDQVAKQLTCDVFFQSQTNDPVHIVNSGFRFGKDPSQNVRDARIEDDVFVIDLSRSFAHPGDSVVECYGTTKSVGANQTFQILNTMIPDSGGLLTATYTFSFPLARSPKKYVLGAPVDAPHGRKRVQLVLGYGNETPSSFMRRKNLDRLAEQTDVLLNKEWQILVRTPAVEVNFDQ
ncbi:MAG: hypothetical protein JWM11_6932 [Planctomycetaceae bacterium]|nr:hypothetical protein [Planctomycetaceae bacterium]